MLYLQDFSHGTLELWQPSSLKVSVAIRPSVYTVQYENQHVHFHNVTSNLELETISCLVQDEKVDRAYVLTWFRVTNQYNKMEVI